MKRKSSILAKNILIEYKREQYMKKKANRLKKMSDKKMGIVKEVKNENCNK